MYDIHWPLDSNRKFESKYWTEKEIEAECQENDWLKNRDAEDGIYTDYPTYDYTYSCYECYTIPELMRCFLYGNWSIRQCFTYKDLAFINQVNAGDEWWALKKQKDGTIVAFDSITMVAVINDEKTRFITAYRSPSDKQYTWSWEVEEEVKRLNETLHQTFGENVGRFITGKFIRGSDEFDIHYEYIDRSGFKDYINEMVEATVLRWYGYREVDGVVMDA